MYESAPGFLFLELAKIGFFEIPKTRGQDSYKKFARICFDLFEIDTKLSSFENEMDPRRNSLEDANREAFTIVK